MRRFEHILVDLPLDGQEENLLDWAEHLAELADARRLTFLQACRREEAVPSALPEDFTSWTSPDGEELRRQGEQALAAHLSSARAGQRAYVFLEDDRLKAVLRLARDEAVDLIVTPRPQAKGEAENYVTRLARKAPCAVFSAAVAEPAEDRGVVVPVDYSDHSAAALDFGCALARARGLESVGVLRCFSVPWVRHPASTPREAFRAAYRSFEEEQLATFIRERAPDDLRLEPHVVENPVVVYGIASFVRQNPTDVIVLGSRGLHATSAIFLGSTAESVLREVASSVLVIKPKGTGLNLLASLLID